MLRHFYHKYDDNAILVYGNNWWLQSFTPDASFTCSGISVFLSKVGAPTGTFTLDLYLADVNGKPTGAALTTTTLSYSTLDTIYPGIPIRATFSPGVALTSGTMYVFVLRLSAGNATNAIKITYKLVGDYTGGAAKNSTNGGSTWNDTAYDLMFDVWDANNAGVIDYFAVAIVSGVTRVMRLYRDPAGNSTISWALGVAGSSNCSVRKSSNYIWVAASSTNTNVFRYDTTGTYDSVFGTKTISRGFSHFAVSADNYFGIVLTYTTAFVYLYDPAWTRIFYQNIAVTGYGLNGVAVHDSLDQFIFGGGNGSGGWLNADRQKRSDGTDRFSYWTNAQTIMALCMRASNGNSIGVSWNGVGGVVKEHLVTSNTEVWTRTLSPSAGQAQDIYHHAATDTVFVACSRANNLTLHKLSGVNGTQLANFDTGAITYQISPLRNGNLLVCGGRGADAGGTTCLREIDTSFTVIWRFDTNFNLTIRGAVEGFASPPTIETESSGGTVTPGDTVNFFVTASGTEPLGYQWYKDGVPIDGATLSTYSFTAAKTSAGTYYCIVTNDYGSDQSSDMILVVQYAPEIISQSGVITALTGVHTTLFIVVDALPSATYQWYKGENPIPGAIMSTYEFFATYQDAGIYTCVASNIVGSTESAPITVTVVRNPYYHYSAFNRQIDQDRS